MARIIKNIDDKNFYLNDEVKFRSYAAYVIDNKISVDNIAPDESPLFLYEPYTNIIVQESNGTVIIDGSTPSVTANDVAKEINEVVATVGGSAIQDNTTQDFMPIKDSGAFENSPISYNSTLDRLESTKDFFAPTLISDPGSVKIGDAIISSGGREITAKSLSTGNTAVFDLQSYDDTSFKKATVFDENQVSTTEPIQNTEDTIASGIRTNNFMYIIPADRQAMRIIFKPQGGVITAPFTVILRLQNINNEPSYKETVEPTSSDLTDLGGGIWELKLDNPLMTDLGFSVYGAFEDISLLGGNNFIGPILFGDPDNNNFFPWSEIVVIPVIRKNIATEGWVSDSLDNLNGYLNGMSIERQSLTLVVEGTSVYLDVEAIGGGDMTYWIDDEKYVLNCTTGTGVGGKARIEIPQGSVTDPILSQVYVAYDEQLDQLVLVDTNSILPIGSYAPVALLVIQDYASVAANGALAFQRTTEAISHDGKSAISWEREKLRAIGAQYGDGIDNHVNITTNVASEDNVNFITTSGEVFQLHRQQFPAYDISTDGIWVTNVSGNGILANYQKITDLNSIHEIADGTALNDGDSINLIIWGSINYSTGDTKIFVSLPNGKYDNVCYSVADINRTAETVIPKEFKNTGFLISKLVLKYNTADNGTWTNLITDVEEIWHTANQTWNTPNWPSNYPNDYYGYLATLTYPGALKIRIKFDEFNTEANFDYIFLRDGISDTDIYTYHGNLGPFTSSIIEGDTMRVLFYSDNIITRRGVRSTTFEYTTIDVSGQAVIDLRGLHSGYDLGTGGCAPANGGGYFTITENTYMEFKDNYYKIDATFIPWEDMHDIIWNATEIRFEYTGDGTTLNFVYDFSAANNTNATKLRYTAFKNGFEITGAVATTDFINNNKDQRMGINFQVTLVKGDYLELYVQGDLDGTTTYTSNCQLSIK